MKRSGIMRCVLGLAWLIGGGGPAWGAAASGWSLLQVNRMPDAAAIYGAKVNVPFLNNDAVAVYGWDLGVANREERVVGVQSGILASLTEQGGGVQLAAIFNQAGSSESAFWQLGLINSLAAAQTGVVNHRGQLQLGVVNIGDGGSGLQLGLVNFLPGAWLPLTLGINFSW